MAAKEVLETWFATTSIAGLSHAAHSKTPWIRAAWFVIFLVGLGVTIYQVEHVLKLYFGYPVTTTVSLGHDVQVKEGLAHECYYQFEKYQDSQASS